MRLRLKALQTVQINNIFKLFFIVKTQLESPFSISLILHKKLSKSALNDDFQSSPELVLDQLPDSVANYQFMLKRKSHHKDHNFRIKLSSFRFIQGNFRNCILSFGVYGKEESAAVGEITPKSSFGLCPVHKAFHRIAGGQSPHIFSITFKNY